MGVIGKFIGSLVSYSKIGVWNFGWADIVKLFPGIFAYAIPVSVGIWILSWLKTRNRVDLKVERQVKKVEKKRVE
jgi:hypothetical protein